MAERYWLREQSTNVLTGRLTESIPLPAVPGHLWSRESDIRAVFPDGPIAPGATFDGTTYTAPALTTIEQIRINARTEALRILSWQAEVTRDNAHLYPAALNTRVRDFLLYAHHGLNRCMRSTAHSDAVRLGFLTGWKFGPLDGETLPKFYVAAASVSTPTSAYVWSHTVSISPIALGGQQPNNLAYASVPVPTDLRGGRWADSLVSNG